MPAGSSESRFSQHQKSLEIQHRDQGWRRCAPKGWLQWLHLTHLIMNYNHPCKCRSRISTKKAFLKIINSYYLQTIFKRFFKRHPMRSLGFPRQEKRPLSSTLCQCFYAVGMFWVGRIGSPVAGRAGPVSVTNSAISGHGTLHHPHSRRSPPSSIWDVGWECFVDKIY